MKNKYAFSFLLFLLPFASLMRAQDVTGSPAVSGRYQQVDLSPDTPCGCDLKTPRHQQLYTSVTESDMRTYRMYAYRIGIGSPAHGASKLFRTLELDPAVMKISVREWDYMLVFVTAEFDKASFDAAASRVFTLYNEIPAADYFRNKNAGLYQTFQQVYPQGYTVSSSAK